MGDKAVACDELHHRQRRGLTNPAYQGPPHIGEAHATQHPAKSTFRNHTWSPHSADSSAINCADWMCEQTPSLHALRTRLAGSKFAVKVARVAQACSGAEGTPRQWVSLSAELDLGRKVALPDLQERNAEVGSWNHQDRRAPPPTCPRLAP